MSCRVAAAGALIGICAALAPSAAAGAARPCPPLSVAAVAALPQQGVLSTDLDGDGRIDRSGLAVRTDVRVSCRYVLWARLASGTASTVVRQPSFEGGSVYPYLTESARIDRPRGAQLVVDFGIGAGVDSYGVYRVVGARIVRVRVGGTAGPALDTFQAGGTLAGAVATICAAGAGSGAVISAGYPGSPPFRIPVTGTYYREHGGAYRAVPRRHRLTAAERRQWLAAWRNGSRAPVFGNCAVAVAH